LTARDGRKEKASKGFSSMEKATVESRLEHPSRRASDSTPEFATAGWVVAADLADIGEPSDRRFFAVGLAEADQSVEAVLRYPGMMREDRRFAIRPLSPEEISGLGLRVQAVRPYGEVLKT
jgi:hypothetical protein